MKKNIVNLKTLKHFTKQKCKLFIFIKLLNNLNDLSFNNRVLTLIMYAVINLLIINDFKYLTLHHGI